MLWYTAHREAVSYLLFELQIWNRCEAAFSCRDDVLNTKCDRCDGHRILLFIRCPFQTNHAAEM
jgi:hypothetical protein